MYTDIVNIKDVLGNKVEEETHIGNINPYRYRSYYYDKETNLYYLNSRYYNPVWGRFLNADGIIGTSENYLGYNLYAYCENNPITNKDTSGNFSFKNLWNTISNGAKKVAKSTFKYVTQKVSSFIGKHTNLPISSSMLNSALSDNNLSNKTRNQIVTKVKNSLEMKKKVNECVSKNKNKETFTCINSSKFESDLDLKLSIGKFSYKIDGSRNLDSGLITMQVKIFDKYDFTEERKWNSVGNIANNFGYYSQNFNLITPYSWDVSYELVTFNN